MNSRIEELLPHRWQPQSRIGGTVKVAWLAAYAAPGQTALRR
jgi:hypothetical protein